MTGKERIRCLAVTGATASGKTALAIALAQALNGEIISCDSMQVYRDMDIGTAKATAEERAAVPHHMIDILDPVASFSAAEYAERAEAAVKEIAARGRLPIFCGGTGLYLEAVRTARHGAPMESDPTFRTEAEAYAKQMGNEALHARLQTVDPLSAAEIHPNNVKRVIRALEIYHVTGKPKSVTDREACEENPSLSVFNLFLRFHSRELLYRRIDERVEAMVSEGLLAETEWLYRTGRLRPHTTAAAAIGYKECLGVVTGELTVTEAKAALKNATHHYAKRQETWFSAKEHTPLYMDTEAGELRPADEVLAEALALVRKHLECK